MHPNSRIRHSNRSEWFSKSNLAWCKWHILCSAQSKLLEKWPPLAHFPVSTRSIFSTFFTIRVELRNSASDLWKISGSSVANSSKFENLSEIDSPSWFSSSGCNVVPIRNAEFQSKRIKQGLFKKYSMLLPQKIDERKYIISVFVWIQGAPSEMHGKIDVWKPVAPRSTMNLQYQSSKLNGKSDFTQADHPPNARWSINLFWKATSLFQAAYDGMSPHCKKCTAKRGSILCFGSKKLLNKQWVISQKPPCNI